MRIITLYSLFTLWAWEEEVQKKCGMIKIEDENKSVNAKKQHQVLFHFISSSTLKPLCCFPPFNCNVYCVLVKEMKTRRREWEDCNNASHTHIELREDEKHSVLYSIVKFLFDLVVACFSAHLSTGVCRLLLLLLFFLFRWVESFLCSLHHRFKCLSLPERMKLL